MNGELTIDELIGMVLDLQGRMQVLQEQNALLVRRVSELEKENEELRSQLSGGGKSGKAPEWVKPNKPKGPPKERKKRGQAYFRRRQTPTRTEDHAYEQCPDCGRPLCGGTVHHSREVIEIPPVRAEVVEHRFISRYCGVCGKSYVPKVDLGQEVLGTHRFGIGVMSTVAYLSIVGRMPKQTIRKLFSSLFGVEISSGEITKILSAVASCGSKEAERLLHAARQSPWVHADETGWRQNGENGYIWSLSTPKVRYLVWNKSRSGQVAKELIGEDYEGVVVSDFLSSYNVLLCGHQRCWVHFLRDLHKLVENNPQDEEVSAWAEKIRKVYQRAKGTSGKEIGDRRKLRRRFESALRKLAEPYLGTDRPQRVLSERIVRYAHEMFTFVEHPSIPSENNAAERSVRPAVIARKVCGGTRSERGTVAKMTLMSLFGTWLIRGYDGIESCRALLAGRSVLFPQPA